MDTTTYTTTRIGRNGKPLAGSPERKYLTDTAERAARNAARTTLTGRELRLGDVRQDGDVWTFTPMDGSPVIIRVTATTPRCTACGEPVEHIDGIGWVETAEGGHYDQCPERHDDDTDTAHGHTTAPQAADPDDTGCYGHESLDGAHMGETVYCNGTCR
jgi:hypothetical protein